MILEVNAEEVLVDGEELEKVGGGTDVLVPKVVILEVDAEEDLVDREELEEVGGTNVLALLAVDAEEVSVDREEVEEDVEV